MAALQYLMREYPEGYEEERVVLVNASDQTLPFYPELEHVSYYGFGDISSLPMKGRSPWILQPKDPLL